MISQTRRTIVCGVFFFSSLLWAGKAPDIHFERDQFDFGLLTQGATVQVSYPFRNAGKAKLSIEGVYTTCGCTAAAPANPLILPGDWSRIDATFDSRGKMGDVVKQIRVRSNDPVRPMVYLTLKGRIVPSQHPEMTGPQNLFTGTCKTCHADLGTGKKGEALYMSSCAMCHENEKRAGHFIAPAVSQLGSLPKNKIRKILAHGKPNSSMPAFALSKGGPLADEQIASLVTYLVEMAKIKRKEISK